MDKTIYEKVMGYLKDKRSEFLLLGLLAFGSTQAIGCADQEFNSTGNTTKSAAVKKLTPQEREQFKDLSFACSLCREELAAWCNKNSVTKEEAIKIIHEISEHERVNKRILEDPKNKDNERRFDSKKIVEKRNEAHNISHQLKNAGVTKGTFIGGELVDPVKGPNERQRAIIKATEKLKTEMNNATLVQPIQTQGGSVSASFMQEFDEYDAKVRTLTSEDLQRIDKEGKEAMERERARTAEDLTNF